MADTATFILLALILIASFVSLHRYGPSRITADSRKLPLPPGPKPEFILGNTRQLPTHSSWLKFSEWRKKFGDILYLSTVGGPIVVLNSYESMYGLLQRKSSCADRPVFQMAGRLIGFDRMINIRQSDEKWKAGRKIIQSALNNEAIRSFYPSLEGATRTCLLQLLDSPHDFIGHFRLLTGKVIVLFTYGLKVESSQDELIAINNEAVEPSLGYFAPGAVLVDTFPILRHVPSWIPGAGFKRSAKSIKKKLDRMFEVPFNRVKTDMVAGTAMPSFTLDNLQNNIYDESDQLASSGSMYIAAVDTTVATLSSFILAMALYPNVQRKAQAEIDHIIKEGALPSFEDRDRLPYIGLLMKELQRWKPVLNLGVLHFATTEDDYGGKCYHIPKGSTVIPNIWAVTQDEDNYKDPNRFWPERFENPETAELDPYKYAFGFGRRICPGLHFADATIYITVVSILAAFNISKPRDENGSEVELDVPYTLGLISCPENFECAIQPRSVAVASLVRTAAEEQGW
ncbi:hypothetical protein BOTBODRAFT_635564 [Botryobasidium botryosum FD-172 SS1]|uniref:Cytochrome P450 n=1 Tax=Botryobasidium botryosum (strain FD-172 SS1) TaxID=930990 RepID=A0A067MB17_BOTB1|nr:hypothetical protein BOTBODRAFT_635564 [Botryobasidium botryosum FD-172 SS1]